MKTKHYLLVIALGVIMNTAHTTSSCPAATYLSY